MLSKPNKLILVVYSRRQDHNGFYSRMIHNYLLGFHLKIFYMFKLQIQVQFLDL